MSGHQSCSYRRNTHSFSNAIPSHDHLRPVIGVGKYHTTHVCTHHSIRFVWVIHIPSVQFPGHWVDLLAQTSILQVIIGDLRSNRSIYHVSTVTHTWKTRCPFIAANKLNCHLYADDTTSIYPCLPEKNVKLDRHKQQS